MSQRCQGCQSRRRRHGQTAGRAARLRLGLQLDRGGGGAARGVALEPARRRLRHRRRDACSPPPCSPGTDLKVPRGEYIAHHGGRLPQRRGVSDLLRLRANERRDLARHHHHLFDADLDHGAQPRRAGRTAERDSHGGVRPLRRRLDDPGVAAVRERISALRVLLARLRAELGRGHRLYQMGEGHRRAAGQCRLAIAVRLFLHRRRQFRVRRLSAFVAAASRNIPGDPVRRVLRRRPRAFPVVVDRRAVVDHHGLARLAAGAGDRRLGVAPSCSASG